MPDFSYRGTSPTYGSQSWNASIPTFSSVMGSSPSDLISLINSLRQSNAQQNFGFQSNLMDREIAGQRDLATLGHESDADLQAGRIGEEGRQFDASTAFGREQETNRYRHLDALLANQRQNETHDRWLQDQQRWDVLRASMPAAPVRDLPRQPNVNAASFSDRLNHNNEIGDWLAQSGRLRGVNNWATPQQVVQPSYNRRY